MLEVRGGNPLGGTVRVRGAKNLVPKAMVASLLGETPSVLRGVPQIRDVEIVTGLLELHGVRVTQAATGRTPTVSSTSTPPRSRRLDRRHRRPRRILPDPHPLLRAPAPQPRAGFIPDLGGCHIGDRPINFHLDVLRQFGAEVDKTAGGIMLSTTRRLQGTKVELPYPSVGATEQVLLTAVRAEGITELRGAAIEPEIMDLIALLQKMGAIITVDTDRVVRIEGVDSLHGSSTGPCPTATRPPPGRPRPWPPAATSSSKAPPSRR